MELLIHPLSILSRHVITGIPIFFQSIPSVLMLIYTIYLIGKKGKKFDLTFRPRVVYFLTAILATQGIAIIRTIAVFPMTGVSVYERYFQFLSLIIYITVGYLFMHNMLDTEQKIVNFFKGVYISFGALLVLLLAQLAFIRYGLFQAPLDFIMTHFSQLPYIDENARVSTRTGIQYLIQERFPNGLDPESRDVAVRLILTCISFMLAAFRNRLPFKGSLALGKTIQVGAIFMVVFILFLVATRTTLILAMLTAAFFLLYFFTERSKHDHIVRKVTGGLLFIGLVAILIMNFGEISETLYSTFAGQGGRNRRLGVMASLNTFLQHPIIGVGYEFSDMWNIMNAPFDLASDPRNVDVFLSGYTLPSFSVLWGWLSQFGLIVLLPIVGYFIRLKLDFTMLVERLNRTQCTDWQKSFFGTVNDSFFLFIIYFIPTSFLQFDWSSLSYLLVVLYFIVTKNYLQNYLNIVAPIGEGEMM